VNPPFGEITKWLEKAITELHKGKKSVFLITFRPNTKYWSQWVFPFASEIRVLEGNLKFQGYSKAFPVPIVLVVFDPAVKSHWKYTKKTNYSYWNLEK
jgi:hypothetical protein